MAGLIIFLFVYILVDEFRMITIHKAQSAAKPKVFQLQSVKYDKFITGNVVTNAVLGKVSHSNKSTTRNKRFK